jgi:hypothetical protein
MVSVSLFVRYMERKLTAGTCLRTFSVSPLRFSADIYIVESHGAYYIHITYKIAGTCIGDRYKATEMRHLLEIASKLDSAHGIFATHI